MSEFSEFLAIEALWNAARKPVESRRTPSLDRVEEKGQGEACRKALDANDLSMEFAVRNSERENKQMRYPDLRGSSS
ncbi:hypothetical protein B7R78_0021965 [Ralstonia solanacearum]|uniref:hypothetical protein n=1 Tax=Ralstonia solanacearum species complex TaxID=3116862 RepID=UPI0013A635BB|nr:hypothetical protein [Ralstonia solanacearum]MBT1539646.1 hypothetical protein [Ralstonia solanacearum]QOK84152.1 hypothetical protein HF906_18670 [Ralstonia solanacearum]